MDRMTSPSFVSSISFPLLGLGGCTLLLSLAFCCYMWRLRSQGNLNRGYKKVKFSKKKKKLQNETCPVCLEDFLPKESIAVCNCQHGFHQKCLQSWLRRRPICPMCKAPVPTEQEETTVLMP